MTAYAEWALGTSRGASAPRIVTALEPETQAILVRNPWNTEFGGRVAFLDLGGRQTAWTADRTEFLGRNGAPDRPAGLDRGHRLRGAVGAGLDPCAALQTELRARRRGADRRSSCCSARRTTPPRRSTSSGAARAADHEATLRAVADYWDDAQGTVQVRTPDRSMDIMLNRWLIYQTLACRLWARTAFYQAGGAYGFRDQLQDVIALRRPRSASSRGSTSCGPRPASSSRATSSTGGIRRRVAASGRGSPTIASGCRTRSIATSRSPATPRSSTRPSRTSRARPCGRTRRTPTSSRSARRSRPRCSTTARRRIDRSLAVGAHGLPLIGSGDWNDGMNRVGHEGRGESVWLGWFLHAVLAAFAPIAEARGDAASRRALASAHEGAASGRSSATAGTATGTAGPSSTTARPLGSAVERRVPDRLDRPVVERPVRAPPIPPRAERAMAAVEEYLVRRGDGLVLLFTPPFDHSDVDPGYVKGYLPGIRENGGQYTHGAIWSVLAFAALGDGDKAGELFSILNPINHASTRAGVHRYKVEPYVMAADVYAEPPHVGRGGWTWYTGSAGWMYQAGVEWILGFRLRGTTLAARPMHPARLAGLRDRLPLSLRHVRDRRGEPAGRQPRAWRRSELDGQPLAGGGAAIPLVDDGATHRVRVVLG